jgi:hypothetical protein
MAAAPMAPGLRAPLAGRTAMARPRPSSPGRKAPRPPRETLAPPRVRRRQKSARAAVRKKTMLMEHEPSRREIPGVMKRRLPIR